jgi:hypothetical protein
MQVKAMLQRVTRWRPFTRMFVTAGAAAVLAISLVYLVPASRGVGFAQVIPPTTQLPTTLTTLDPTTLLPTTSTTILPTTILPTTILPTTSTTILPTTQLPTTSPPPPPLVLDHFMCYDVTEVDKEQGPRPKIRVEVTNQFGTAFFMVDKPRLLCVPSAKTELP